MLAKLTVSALLTRLVLAALAVLSVLACPAALGSGPRWVSGPPFFNNSGNPITWYTTSPQYFTDPGDLSASVNHAAAETLVANAAAVWNIPTASLVLTRGGSLEEHVSSANINVGSTGLTFPADIQAGNYLNKQIAVLYDTDGSVTDLMLGTGASDPSGCRQAAVTESVDSFAPSGQILHAVLVLNGRCTGPNPDQQTQMQYQLMRAFGRVLGLGWSQTNDNVFTGSPTPNPDQVANWPVMHPIDIICGPYTYKCMPQPFVLRPDDIASLAFVYPMNQGQAPAGKQDTLANAFTLDGFVFFNDSQGMEEVNVTVRRHHMFWITVEDWQSVSGVAGYSFRPQTSTPVTVQEGSPVSSVGSYDDWREGYFRMTGIQIGATDAWETVVLQTEPINPLYTGPYAVGAYNGNTMAPSGQSVTQESQLAPRYGWNREGIFPPNGPGQCTAVADGTVNAPVPTPAQGWWNGTLCGYGHSAWNALSLRAGRTLAVEVTALDEQGNASMAKAMPVLGVWNNSDAGGVAPTLGSSPAAFNSMVAGMTSLELRSSAAAATVRFAIADQRGAGRPDFGYQARVLYADSIVPANVPTTGATVTITGMGFRSGMSVLVRGVAATVSSITANQIVATVPSLRALGMTRPTVVDVAVSDPSTGGSSTMSGALGYASSAERLQVISVPSGNINVGTPAPTPFAVQVVSSDGVTPVAGESVTFTVASGSARFGVCGNSVCTVLTDAHGLASTSLTASAAGALTLSVATPSVSLTPFRLVATIAPDTLRLVSAPAGVQTVGLLTSASFAVKLTAGDGVTARAGQTVTFSATGAAVLFSACGGALCSVTTDSNGVASTPLTLVAPGTAVLTANSSAGSVSASVSAAAPTMHLLSAPSGMVTMGLPVGTSFSVQALAGDGVTPLAGEAIAFMANGGGVQFSPCGVATCTVVSDAHGTASVTVTPTTAGSVTLSAASRAGLVTAAFTSGAQVLHLVSAPSGSVSVGAAAATAFTVQLLQADGTAPVAGGAVQFSVGTGSAQLSGCPVLLCTLRTDAQGRAAVTITPLAAGTTTIIANAAGTTQSVSILGIALPNVLQTVSVPSGPVYAGDVSSTPFAVRVMTGDLRSCVAGQVVTFSVAGSSAVFTACGLAVCTMSTDATGLATTTVSGLSPGQVQVQATASAGSVAASLTIVARHRSVTALHPILYIAEGAPFAWANQVTLADDSGSVDGVQVSWVSNGPVRFAGASSSTVSGASTMETTVSRIGAGVIARGTACAWRTVCAELGATGVSGTEFRLAIAEGAGQSIASTDSFAPVRVLVQNAAGDPVAGATVVIRETVTAWESTCPAQGRCAASAVLKNSRQTLTSDANGYVAVLPDGISGTPGVTSLAVSAGTQGFTTLSVERHP